MLGFGECFKALEIEPYCQKHVKVRRTSIDFFIEAMSPYRATLSYLCGPAMKTMS